MTNYTLIKLDIESRTCPIHNIRPLAKIEDGKIVLRCCCDYFTGKCFARVDRMLKDSLVHVVDAWEEDLANDDRRVA